MKTATKLTGSVRTSDVWAAGLKVGRDIVKLDANRDGVITKTEKTTGEKRLGLDAAERKVISKVLATSIPERGGVSTWSASIVPPYAAEHLANLDTKGTGKVKAKNLSKLTFPKSEGPHGIDRVASKLAPDFFEYVQAEEKAGKKI